MEKVMRFEEDIELQLESENVANHQEVEGAPRQEVPEEKEAAAQVEEAAIVHSPPVLPPASEGRPEG